MTNFARLANSGVIVVAAAGNAYAGNGNAAGVSYPAADPNVLAVSAVWADNFGSQSFSGATNHTTAADHVAGYSQRHSLLTDALAPGGMITTANLGGGITSRRGTSFAAPFVTGAAALAQQLAEQEMDRRLTVAEFRERLQSTGVLINDGDDENDTVQNTGADYRRLDIFALGESLLANPGLPSILISDITVTEGNSGATTAAVVVQISRSPRTDVTVDFSTADGTATLAGNDYTQTTGLLTFSPTGSLTQTILVPIVGDLVHEPTETFRVLLSNATDATLVDPLGIVTVLDNDRPLPWRNPVNPFDVNDNGHVTGVDGARHHQQAEYHGPATLARPAARAASLL